MSSPRVIIAAVVAVLADAGVPPAARAQTPASAADGPWSGQVQCVLSVRAPDYQDDQTHTWRITGGPPLMSGAFRRWPAVWSVQGSGSRGLAADTVPRRAARLGAPSETWKTTVPETSAPIAFWEPAAGRIRIGSQHGLLNANGAISGSSSAGGVITSALQEWEFPVVEDAATATTISGTRTRSVTQGRGWLQPAGALTTETCTWHYTRGDAAPASLSSAAVTGTTVAAPTIAFAGSAGAIQPVPAPETSLPSTDTLRRTGLPSPGAVAALSSVLAPARTITLAGFTATGPVPPRTIALAGFTATGPVPPRTITLSGWSAAGP